ncbi:MAG TPA: helicase-related protein [Alphaproteobacteria bacterium]|nr:helicase-related protein [Alphaproteobacteria bacterium]
MTNPRRPPIAVLGPTNTGKTHLALERMLGHKSGMIGFPLRLLARENYDRIVRLKGPQAVALVTGEEKIVPAHPAYWVCTVEAMPLDRAVEFLAIDEIQVASDPDRGHVFTDRLLHARGLEETMLLGADTIRPHLKKLVPGVEFIARPRFSKLTYTGPRKLTRLPPRTAVVAFSVQEVYALAEAIRRQRGGTAVVLGALSPRTRNAQVAMYQAGEVDYLVATDAIGMGLNMDVSHVAFSSLIKFDGWAPRKLSAAELAQIAGRAGRYMADGTFGTTGELGALEPELVSAIEDHRFDALKVLYWRNPELDFRSLAALERSLETPPRISFLRRAREQEDVQALAALARDDEVAPRVQGGAAVRLLWEVCQIPDFRKIMSDAHARLLKRIFLHLASAEERLPEDWVAAQLAALDRPDGDIDTLVQRIAFVRTWTYISHRGDWLANAAHWQERARAIEDRLSDALHERLTQRFVDRRAASLQRRMRDGGELLGAVTRTGTVLVEGEAVGRLEGFRFLPDESGTREEARALMSAVLRALKTELPARVERCLADPNAAFELRADGRLLWHGAPVAYLEGGAHPLRPRLLLLPSELIAPQAREALRRHLAAELDALLRKSLAPLYALETAALEGEARGLAYQLKEALGIVPRAAVAKLVAALDGRGRAALQRLGVRFGVDAVYLPALLKPAPIAAKTLLWAVHHDMVDLVVPPPAGRVSLLLDPAVPAAYYEAIGYRTLGRIAVRADRLERLALEVRRRARGGSFADTSGLLPLVACRKEDLSEVLAALGYRRVGDNGEERFVRQGRGKAQSRAARRRKRAKAGERVPEPTDSPFAVLKELRLGR